MHGQFWGYNNLPMMKKQWDVPGGCKSHSDLGVGAILAGIGGRLAESN
jgi:hypothetical protein